MKNSKQIGSIILTIRCLWILILITFALYVVYNFKSLNNNTLMEDNEEWIPVSEIDISAVSDEIVGYLSFPSLNDNFYLDMPIKEGTDLSIIATAIGHFTETYKNICLVAHNSGTNANGIYVGYFDLIKNFKEGDVIIYNNLIKDYYYKVISNAIINDKDLSILQETDDDRLTLITCVKGSRNKEYRQCVIAKRVEEG